MTDQPPTGAPPAPPAGPDWQNIVALSIAAATALGGLVAVKMGVAADSAMNFCGPVITACAMAYQARGRAAP